MIRLRGRPLGPAPDVREVEVGVRDEPFAHLHHFCPSDGRQRLLGVSFSGDERARLRGGGAVRLPVRCDRCPWEALAVFRLQTGEE